MPEISRFFGIVIRMFAKPGGPHHRPHFDAYYQDGVAIVTIDRIEVIAGGLPRQQQRLIEAWAEIHHQELLDDWALSRPGAHQSRLNR